MPPHLYLPANVATGAGLVPRAGRGTPPCHGRNTALTQPTNGQRGPAHLGGWAVFRSSALFPTRPSPARNPISVRIMRLRPTRLCDFSKPVDTTRAISVYTVIYSHGMPGKP